MIATAVLMLLPVVADAATPDKAADPVSASDMILGNPKAKVTVIEYGSVACPYCAQFNETVMQDIKAKYIATGKIAYVYRPMLTGVQTIAASGERIAECAGRNRYFSVIDAIMRGQHEYYAMGENDMLARPVLLRIARSVGIDEAAFGKCVTDPAAVKTLNTSYNRYLAAGITSTPSFFINGKPFDYKGGGIDEFDKAIADAQ